MPNTIVSNHPLIQHKLSILRDKNTKPNEFRSLVSELGTLLCYEATRDLPLVSKVIETPLMQTTTNVLAEKIALIPILRAGLGMVDGIWNLIPNACVLHIGLYRNEETLKPVEYYNKLANYRTVEHCLILDPMLATGGSAIAVADILKKWGAKSIRFVGLIGAPEGVEALHKAHPDIDIHLAAIDEKLNENGYILPGLGDAGDRQFGTVDLF
ncbi:MAG: uracil phosphoribosyltransferase [Anaerolineaceae bacterium]|nr:uracil phosphoribosyltransferase [Anaerolineaceae bacterium]